MKRLCCILCLLMLMTGCGANGAEQVTPLSTESVPVPVQTEKTQQETILSHELAMLEGYVVMDEGDVRHNTDVWVNFLDTCEAGNATSVTVVSFFLEDAGYDYVKYVLNFDGSIYTVDYERNGELLQESAPELTYSTGLLDSSNEPYDSYERYALNDVVIYTDLIASPEFEGVKEIYLHDKEGNPPINTYTGDALQPILELLWTAKYVPCEPENYVYGMKLLMTNRDGKELVIELDLNKGFYRYGMQTYKYGEVSNMLAALKMEQWPDSVLAEFGDYLK